MHQPALLLVAVVFVSGILSPFINRVHSGEAFGDGGVVFAMLWGTTLAFLTISGLIIYLTMRRKNRTGLQRIFW